MIGRYRIELYSNRLKFDVTVERKYTIIRGNSGIGKSVFANMVKSYQSDVNHGGLTLNCDIPVISPSGVFWKSEMLQNTGMIFVIDEQDACMSDKEFCSVLNNSDNYFILITRGELSGIPYSINSIYTLETYKGKSSINKTFYVSELSQVYVDNPCAVTPELMLVEDSKAGFEFFKTVFKNCETCDGNSNAYATIRKYYYKGYRSIALIVDGAAFGAFIIQAL